MSIEHNVAVMREWLAEGWSKGNVDVADHLVSTEFLVHGAGGQSVKSGPDGVKDLVRAWRVAFPDGVMSVLEDIPEGDKVGVRLLWRGTHLGEFYGIPPSGKKVECISFGIDRVGTDGKICEGWGELDMLGLMQQVGAMPAMGPSVPADPAVTEPSTPKPTTTSPADAKKIVLSFMEAVNKFDTVAIKSMVDPKVFVEHNPGFGASNLDAALEGYSVLLKGIPDLKVTPDPSLVLAANDKVVTRSVITGTHSGELFGAAATGKKLDWSVIHITRVTDGLITERWVCADTLRFFQQIGLIPSQG